MYEAMTSNDNGKQINHHDARASPTSEKVPKVSCYFSDVKKGGKCHTTTS